MKRLFSTSFNLGLTHLWLFIFRVTAGAFMLTHGYPKLTRLFSGAEIQFADPFGFGPATTLVLAVFAEFLCSILIILGLATRFAAIPIIITMLVAAFSAHAADPFARKELPLLFLLVFTTIAVFGAGKYSFDSMLQRKKRRY